VNDFRISISSPPDREHLVAEVFVGNEQLAEVNHEHGAWSVEFYPRASGEPWRLSFDAALRILQDAKSRLGRRDQSPTVPDADALKKIVCRAVQRLYKSDQFLLENDASERSIAHRLAIHLASELSEPRLDVDVEFDCMTEGLEQTKKRLMSLKGLDRPRGKGKRSGDVYPDIIIHARSDSLHNALVVEVKRETNHAEREWDLEKLREFTKDSGLDYRLGCFLVVAAERATAQWFQAGEPEGEQECIT
jgi:hypothetical protein